MSNNANGSRWQEGQPNPDIAIGDGMGALDAFVSEIATVDFTPNVDITLSLAVYCSAYTFVLINASAPRVLTFPASKKRSRVKNASGQTIVLKVGTSTLTILNGNTATVYTDGTANGLEKDNSGLPSGGATGQVLTKRSPADLDIDWETPATGGGGGGGDGSVIHKLTQVSVNSDQNMSGWTSINWGNMIRDDVSAWSVGAQSRLVTPAGYSLVRLNIYVVYTNTGSGNRYIRVSKNGSPFRLNAGGAYNESGQEIVTQWLPTSEGDYWTVEALNGTVAGSGFCSPCVFEADWSN